MTAPFLKAMLTASLLASAAAEAESPRQVALIIDQAGTPCVSAFAAGTWGWAVAPESSIGDRFTVPAGQVFILTDVEWSYTGIDPTNPPVLELGSDFAGHYWTPFLELDTDHVTGTVASGRLHLHTGIAITSKDPVSAFCIVANGPEPTRFNAQGHFAPLDRDGG
jgi:hypothetical protein